MDRQITHMKLLKNIVWDIKNNKNSGLAYSLNQCLKHVNGKYVARMDADDFCLPERFEKQVKFLDGNLEYQVVGSSVQLFDGINDLNIRQLKEIPEKKDLINGSPLTLVTGISHQILIKNQELLA